MLKRSTIQLLRIQFSFFLLPVFLFALSDVYQIHWWKAVYIFFILHLLVYPSSNGYNSYMDRDESPIGGIARPLQPTTQLFHFSILLDIVALCGSVFISIPFTLGLTAYILASRAYSFRGIRLKRFPLIGYLVVIVFQGALTYFLVYQGSSALDAFNIPFSGLFASSLLIGGFYPLTQIYQHESDRKDGVTTISMLLGYKGTFFFTAIIYMLAMGMLFYHFVSRGFQENFYILATVMLPVLVYFFYWMRLVWYNQAAADFKNTMRMNWLAAFCTNLAFLIMLIRRLS